MEVSAASLTKVQNALENCHAVVNSFHHPSDNSFRALEGQLTV
jgi:hypothetical protein